MPVCDKVLSSGEAVFIQVQRIPGTDSVLNADGSVPAKYKFTSDYLGFIDGYEGTDNSRHLFQGDPFTAWAYASAKLFGAEVRLAEVQVEFSFLELKAEERQRGFPSQF